MKIVCIKYGDKFSFEHVNRLYKMVKKNFKEKFDFYCHTENSEKINEAVKIVPLPKEWEVYKTEDYPYWVKLHSFFEKPTKETTIYFDLDIVIQNDITHLSKYCVNNKICFVKAYWKPHFHLKIPQAPNYDMDLNASVMIWKGDCTWAWKKFKENLNHYALMYNGTDPYLHHRHFGRLNWLPRGEVYSRLYGIDENDYYNPYDPNSKVKYYYNKDYKICIFNGWKRKKHKDGTYKLDDDGYKGFEKYFEDPSIINLENNTMDLDFFKRIRYLCWDNDDLYKQILDSFSPSQFKSKLNLIKMLDNLNVINEKTDIAVFGCWFNSTIGSLLHNRVNNITGYDVDSQAIHIGKKLFENVLNINFEKADIFKFGRHKKKLNNIDIIINTSCEHMKPLKEWSHWNNIKNKTIFALQSNNMFHIKDHTNCVKSIEDFIKQLPPKFKVIFTDEVTLKDGIRFTIIGKYEKSNL